METYKRNRVAGRREEIKLTRKVYLMMLVQFVLVSLFLTVGAESKDYQEFITKGDNRWIYIVSCVLFGLFGLLIFVNKNVAELTPLNYIMLGIISVTMAYNMY